jgi:hypothetical protein
MERQQREDGSDDMTADYAQRFKRGHAHGQHEPERLGRPAVSVASREAPIVSVVMIAILFGGSPARAQGLSAEASVELVAAAQAKVLLRIPVAFDPFRESFYAGSQLVRSRVHAAVCAAVSPATQEWRYWANPGSQVTRRAFTCR